jgi:hypothetical protein
MNVNVCMKGDYEEIKTVWSLKNKAKQSQSKPISGTIKLIIGQKKSISGTFWCPGNRKD